MNRKYTHPIEVYLRNIHKETNETYDNVTQIKSVEPEFIHRTLPFSEECFSKSVCSRIYSGTCLNERLWFPLHPASWKPRDRSQKHCPNVSRKLKE